MGWFAPSIFNILCVHQNFSAFNLLNFCVAYSLSYLPLSFFYIKNVVSLSVSLYSGCYYRREAEYFSYVFRILHIAQWRNHILLPPPPFPFLLADTEVSENNAENTNTVVSKASPSNRHLQSSLIPPSSFVLYCGNKYSYLFAMRKEKKDWTNNSPIPKVSSFISGKQTADPRKARIWTLL